MGKKKNKIAKLTEEQYVAYIAGLKDGSVPFNSNGDLFIPEQFKRDGEKENQDFKQN